MRHWFVIAGLLAAVLAPCEAQYSRREADRVGYGQPAYARGQADYGRPVETLLFSYKAGDSIAALGGTFSRTSSATFTDANGVIQTATSGALRDSHYIDGARTALLEDARTNLLSRSEEFNTGWGAFGAASTVTADTVVAPDGTVTADTIEFSGNGGRAQGGIATPTVTRFSVWLRADAAGTVNLSPFNNETGAASVNVTTSWQRVGATFTNNGGGAYIRRTAGTTLTKVYVWGAQLEGASTTSSYARSTTSAVTRAADSLVDTQNVAGETLTQYDRYWDTATAAWVDSITTINTGNNYPNPITTFRAYRYRAVAKGVRDLAWFQGKGFTP